MRKVSNWMIVIVVVLAMLLQGCSSNEGTDELSSALIKEVNPSVLSFDSCSEGNDSTTYRFLIESDNAEGVGDSIKAIYDKTNEILNSGKYADEKITIMIGTKDDTPDAFWNVVSLSNYYKDTGEKSYDHITHIYVSGISDSFQGYNMYADYEINDLDYWTYFTDVDLSLDERVIYENVRMKFSYEADDIENYMMGKFGEYVSFDEIYVFENAVHACWIELPVRIDQNIINSTGEFESTIGLTEAMRHELNEYWSKNPDSVLLSCRLNISFRRSSDTWGSFCNFRSDDGFNMTEEFSTVNYFNVSAEELISCKGIRAIDVKFMQLDDVELILEKMTELEYVEGIKYVYDIDDAKIAEIEKTYSSIVFN